MQRIISLPRVSAHGTTSSRSASSIRRTVVNNNQSIIPRAGTVAMLLAGRVHRPFLRCSLGMPPTASSPPCRPRMHHDVATCNWCRGILLATTTTMSALIGACCYSGLLARGVW